MTKKTTIADLRVGDIVLGDEPCNDWLVTSVEDAGNGWHHIGYRWIDPGLRRPGVHDRRSDERVTRMVEKDDG